MEQPISPLSLISRIREFFAQLCERCGGPLSCIKRVWMIGFVRLPEPIQRFLARHRWKVTISLVVFLLLGWGYYAITKEPEPEMVTASVTRGDLVQTVEAVGTVVSERDLNLQFPLSGVVQEVLVKEGDTVEAGQRLASLRANDLKATMNSMLASLQAAQAELAELKEGTRSEDIAVAEAEVANKKAQLDAAKETLTSAEEKLAILEKEASIGISGEIGKARGTVSKELATARTALAVFDDVMNDSDVSDMFQRGAPGMDRLLRNDRNRADAAIRALVGTVLDFTAYASSRTELDQARQAVALASGTIEELYNQLSTLPPTTSFSRSERESRKDDVATQKTNLQTALLALDTSIKSLQDAAASFETSMATQRSTITIAKGDILNLESAIRTEEAQLALKRAGSRPTEIQVSSARVRQAQADYERAKANFDNTVLFAPSKGFITKVNIKTGELLSTAFQQDAAITMLGESPYRIEMFVSEVDIPKVQLTQTGSVELDAFPGKPFPLHVAEIDPAATRVDGVPKYRIKLDFPAANPGLKIGMTGDVDIVTGRVTNVLTVPARAITENEFGDTFVRVLAANGTIEDRRVETGLDGENDVEIVRGLAEGEIVVVLLKK